MDIVNLIISLVSGAVGGNIAGKVMPEKDLGVVLNSIIGLIGGVAGEYVLKALGFMASTGAAGMATGTEMDIGSLLASVGVSGVSGAVLTAIISYVKACGGCCKR